MPQSFPACTQCGYCHTSADCPTDDQVVAWYDSQSEEFLAALPGYADGLTPRQAWNAFFSPSPAAETVSASMSAPADAGQGVGTIRCDECGWSGSDDGWLLRCPMCNWHALVVL